eukprot:8491123-Alexandrium_andersonii.AAC.1
MAGARGRGKLRMRLCPHLGASARAVAFPRGGSGACRACPAFRQAAGAVQGAVDAVGAAFPGMLALAVVERAACAVAAACYAARG